MPLLWSWPHGDHSRPTRALWCVYLYGHQCSLSSMYFLFFALTCIFIHIVNYKLLTHIMFDWSHSLHFCIFHRERTILRLIWICIDSVTFLVKGSKHFKTDWSFVCWMLAWRFRYAIFNRDIVYKVVNFLPVQINLIIHSWVIFHMEQLLP